MRFYKRDGSCKINQGDCEFGWWFCDVFADTKDGRENSKESKYLLRQENELEESAVLALLSERDKELIIEKLEPTVEIHFPIHVQGSQMIPEGDVGNDDLNPLNPSDVITYSRVKQNMKFENVNEKLSNMISSDTLKGKLLISFIDSAKFKMISNGISMTEVETISELEGPSAFLSSSFVAHNIIANQTWSSFHLQTEYDRNKKSLLEEMPAFNNFSQTNGAYLINSSDSTRNLRASEKLDCLPSDSLKLSEADARGNKFLECIELLYQNLRELDEKIREMHKELVRIRIDFQKEDRRTKRLLQESRKFSIELRECNYLNEVLLLLMGQTEKIKSNNWPFKVCSNRKEELNLVI